MAHLKALSHICLHFTEKQHRSTFKVRNLDNYFCQQISSFACSGAQWRGCAQLHAPENKVTLS